MFGLWKRSKPEVVEHWYSLLDDFSTSTTEFYGRIESELTKRQIPGLDIERVHFREGEMTTHKREYLRMVRERLVFDVCSAPFGTGWFFSCRIVTIPFKLRIWELLVLVALLGLLVFKYLSLFGTVGGIATFVLSIIGSLYFLNMKAKASNHDLDSALLKVPVIGALYELFLRQDSSYYREDTRIMYIALVDMVVRDAVRQVTEDQGVEQVEFSQVDSPASPFSLTDKLLVRMAEILPPLLGASPPQRQ